MQKIIKECVSLGFLKVKQIKEKGKFGHNEFEFDLEGRYLKIEGENYGEKCPHNDVSPMPEKPVTVKPVPENQSLPYTRHRPNPGNIYGVTDSDPTTQVKKPEKKARSMTPLKNPSRASMAAPLRFKLDETQTTAYEFLKSLNLEGTQDGRLTWWAKNYSLTRLTEAYLEAKKRKAQNIGGYMCSLLEKGTTLTVGRIEANRELTLKVKDEYKWSELRIYDKFAILEIYGMNIEIPFDLDAKEFYTHLEEKYNRYKKKA